MISHSEPLLHVWDITKDFKWDIFTTWYVALKGQSYYYLENSFSEYKSRGENIT